MMLVTPTTQVVAQTTPPNVVVIVTDDMRYDAMDDMPTVMRELVGKGRSFEQGFITDPVCCPSRTSFLRGQYAHTTTVWDLDGPWGGWGQMQQAGVENQMLNTWLDPSHFTALVGKYQNGYNAVRLPGPTGAWDYGRVFNKVGYTAGGWTYTDGISRRTGQVYSTGFFGDRAVDAIAAAGSQPVFLWYAPYPPHAPSIPEPQYAAETDQCGDVDNRSLPMFNEAGTDSQLVDGANGMKDKGRWQKGKAAFTSSQIQLQGVTRPQEGCRTLLSVDDSIADILAALETKDPGLNNTVIVFTSDQGIQYGDHNQIEKRVAFESTIHVPYVVRADFLLGEAGLPDTENIVLNIDLAPTIVQLAGVAASPGCANEEPYRSACLQRGGGFDGQSFVSLLTPDPVPTPGFADRAFLIEMYDDAAFPEYCAVRTRDAKLIRYEKDQGADFEAYDLAVDPYELHSKVFSAANGVPRFRPADVGGRSGQQLYDQLYPVLTQLCSPLPPDYLPFP